MDKYEENVNLLENQLAFAAWVISNVGDIEGVKKLSVTKALQEFKLLGPSNVQKEKKTMLKEKSMVQLIEKLKKGELELSKIDIPLTEEELKACDFVMQNYTESNMAEREGALEAIRINQLLINVKGYDKANYGCGPRPVKMIDPEQRKVVGVFESSSMAGKITGLHTPGISVALKDKRSFAGYVWVKADLETLNKYKSGKVDEAQLTEMLSEEELALCDKHAIRKKDISYDVAGKIKEYKSTLTKKSISMEKRGGAKRVKAVDPVERKCVGVYVSQTDASKTLDGTPASVGISIRTSSIYRGLLWFDCDDQVYLDYINLVLENKLPKIEDKK